MNEKSFSNAPFKLTLPEVQTLSDEIVFDIRFRFQTGKVTDTSLIKEVFTDRYGSNLKQ